MTEKTDRNKLFEIIDKDVEPNPLINMRSIQYVTSQSMLH
jgi:hypothetical protein